MSWEQKTYDLKYPVTFDGKEYERVTVRALNGNALERLDDVMTEVKDANPGVDPGENGENLQMTARQAMMLLKIAIMEPDGVVGEMHKDDIEGLSAVVAPFIEKASSVKSETSQAGGDPKAT